MRFAPLLILLFFLDACSSEPSRPAVNGKERLPGQDSTAVKTIPADTISAQLSAAQVRSFEKLVDSLVGKVIHKQYDFTRKDFSARVDFSECDDAMLCAKDLVNKGYQSSTRYACTIPKEHLYDVVLYQHRYADTKSADSMMTRIRSLASIMVVFYKCPAYYWRVGASIFSFTLSCAIAHRGDQLLANLRQSWKSISTDHDSIGPDLFPLSEDQQQDSIVPLPLRGYWKLVFHMTIDTCDNYSFGGKYDPEQRKALEGTLLKVQANQFELEGKTYRKLYYGRMEIPDAYRFFDRWEESSPHHKHHPPYPRDIADLHGRIIRYTVQGSRMENRYESRSELEIVDLPNGRRGLILNGCLYYLQKS